jgi:cobalt/nickel transport system permease protein
MHLIDQFAYNNRIRYLNPAIKAGFSMALIFASLILDSLYASGAVLLIVFLSATLLASLPLKTFLRIVLLEAAFLLTGVIGIAISISTIQTQNSLFFAGVWITVTPQSIYLASKVLFRALSCTAALNFLALTTPLTDLVILAKTLKIPSLLSDIMVLIYRFIFSLWDCFERMLLARQARLGFKDLKTSFKSMGEILGMLFIVTLQKSRRLDLALQGRGWEGSLRVLSPQYLSLRDSFQKLNPMNRDEDIQ